MTAHIAARRPPRVGARLRARGFGRDSPIARERAPTGFVAAMRTAARDSRRPMPPHIAARRPPRVGARLRARGFGREGPIARERAPSGSVATMRTGARDPHRPVTAHGAGRHPPRVGARLRAKALVGEAASRASALAREGFHGQAHRDQGRSYRERRIRSTPHTKTPRTGDRCGAVTTRVTGETALRSAGPVRSRRGCRRPRCGPAAARSRAAARCADALRDRSGCGRRGTAPTACRPLHRRARRHRH